MLSANRPDESSLVQCISPSDNSSSEGNILLAKEIYESMNESGTNVTELSNNHTYIFTIPPTSSSQHKCSGTVQYIELCYEVMSSAASRTNLSFLSQSGGEKGDPRPIFLSVVPSMNFCSDEDENEGEEGTGMSKSSKIWRGLRGLFCWLCIWCSCNGEPDSGGDSEEDAPLLCCARASLDTNITIPSSDGIFHINNNTNISILGFTSVTDYTIQNCSTTDETCSSTISYVPFIRFFVGRQVHGD